MENLFWDTLVRILCCVFTLNACKTYTITGEWILVCGKEDGIFLACYPWQSAANQISQSPLIPTAMIDVWENCTTEFYMGFIWELDGNHIFSLPESPKPRSLCPVSGMETPPALGFMRNNVSASQVLYSWTALWGHESMLIQHTCFVDFKNTDHRVPQHLWLKGYIGYYFLPVWVQQELWPHSWY